MLILGDEMTINEMIENEMQQVKALNEALKIIFELKKEGYETKDSLVDHQ
jgi:hypothetical protein